MYMPMINEKAFLSSENHYTIFKFGKYVIRFRALFIF